VDPRIGIVLKMIEEQKGALSLSLTASSRALGVTEEHLLRVFKRELGMTFRQYLRKRRMALAAELVGDSSLAIKHIATLFGYGDVSNFYRDFKEVHGVNPGEWRTANQVFQSHKLPGDDENTSFATSRSETA
jgi:AraC-like DNA-binding protein